MESNNVFQLWMASRGYTVIQQNNYPTALYASAIVATILYSIVSDKIQSRWECSLVIGLTFIVGSAILIADPAKDAAHFFAFYLLGTTYAPQALWYAWMADVTAHDYQLRAITTGFMNSFGKFCTSHITSISIFIADLWLRLCFCDMVAFDLLSSDGCT
jgi:ACS family pantothenate transporter-like MFS transporter